MEWLKEYLAKRPTIRETREGDNFAVESPAKVQGEGPPSLKGDPAKAKAKLAEWLAQYAQEHKGLLRHPPESGAIRSHAEGDNYSVEGPISPPEPRSPPPPPSDEPGVIDQLTDVIKRLARKGPPDRTLDLQPTVSQGGTRE